MLFTSGLFLFVFLPAALALYFGLARALGPVAAAGSLTAMSLIFYGLWAPAYLLLLSFSIAANFGAGWAIQKTPGSIGARRILTAAIAGNLLLLGYFKYYGFLAENLRSVSIPMPALDVILPIGISFYSFTQIAFLVDSYRGKVNETRPLHYTLFVTYFPHLVAGPILHHAEMMPQFADRATYRARLCNFALGAAFLLTGLAKKVLVADSIAIHADRAFAAAAAGALGMAHAWEGAIAYTLQLYFDFSGYSDMAVGISLLFGIQLPYNFNSPYKACSIIEFWRRWHMTLSRFLRDYLYFALGGNRKGQARRFANLFLTMLLGGLWHGAAWTFVIWGALHGAFLITNHGWRWLVGDASWAKGRLARGVGWLLSMLAVVVGWVFFRAQSVGEALNMLSAMAGRVPTVDVLAARETHWMLLLPIGLAAALFPNSQQIVMGPLRNWVERDVARGGAAILMLLGAALVGVFWLALVAASRTSSAFIYFNF